jgi:hypothetical protein
MGTGGSFPGGILAGRKADHSHPANAELKNGGAIPPLPIRLHGVVLNTEASAAFTFLPEMYC